ncbi:MAG: hypothetical protein ABIO06_08385 [Pseudolysinimonas sp.]
MWWSSLFADIVKPSWAAGVVQSFIGAALAFLGALALIRIQLRSDRRIADNQIVALADDRTAERRSKAADYLGRTLIDASRAMDDLTTPEYLRAVRERTDAPGSVAIYDADGDARLLLDLDGTVLDLWRLLQNLWDVLRVNIGAHDGPRRDMRSESALEAGCEKLLQPVQAALKTLGGALVRWDGTGAVPSRERIGDGWQVPLKNATEFKKWQAEKAAEFESERARVYSR